MNAKKKDGPQATWASSIWAVKAPLPAKKVNWKADSFMSPAAGPQTVLSVPQHLLPVFAEN